MDNHIIENMKGFLGEEIINLLLDENTTDIIRNEDGSVWVQTQTSSWRLVKKINDKAVTSFLRISASYNKTIITHDKPILDGVLPFNGERISAQIPPIVSSPTFAIRKKPSRIFTLEDYLCFEKITQHQKEIIETALRDKKNILISGGTGSGKTTFANAIIKKSCDFFPSDRFVIIEDTQEIQCFAENKLSFLMTDSVSIDHLIKATLRMKPDRIIIGEVRDHSALNILDSWNTGHDGGVATLHASSAQNTIQRLKSLVSRHPSAPKDIDFLISTSNLMIIFMANKKVHSIIEHGN